MNRDEFHGVKTEAKEMNSAKILIAKIDGYQLGVEHGKTMAEMDAYYEGLLKEIKELETLLREDNNETGKENNQKG